MSEVNIWDLAQDVAAESTKTGPVERSLVVVGSKSGGKSSIIYRFVDKTDVPKPTVALEYLFSRKQRFGSSIRDVCHIWELGGGSLFTNLLDFVLTPDSLLSISIILVVDMSRPQEMVEPLETLLEHIKEKLDSILSREPNSSIKEILRDTSRERVGVKHEDITDVYPCYVPLVILGSKYDLFQYLRLTAHLNGASLYLTSMKSEAMVNKLKQVLSVLSFGGSEVSIPTVFDHQKPLFIPFGGDSFQLIGYSSLDSVRRVFLQNNPQVEPEVVIPDNPAKDPKFAERDIDLIRSQRDKELEEHRQQLETQNRYDLQSCDRHEY